jgi:anti-anti-sigma factor
VVFSESEWARVLFEVDVVDQDATRTIAPRGEFEVGSAGFVAKALLRGMGGDFEHVVLDLRDTTFIDSAGMAIVVGATERAREEGIGFVVIQGPAGVQRVFDMCGYTDMIPFVSVDPARFASQPVRP